MKTQLPSYITVDIPQPVNTAVREMRRKYGNTHEGIPVEITLAGSSGVGPIPSETPRSLICSEVDRIAQGLSSFEMNFRGLKVFPDTTLSYLEPSDRRIFDQWHELFIYSNIPFSENPFPYNPHCTIRNFSTLKEYEEAARKPFPDETFIIDTISVYDLCTETIQCNLLHRVKLQPIYEP